MRRPIIYYNTLQVVLHWYEGQDKVDLSDYVNSGTWNIMSCPGVYNYTYDLKQCSTLT